MSEADTALYEALLQHLKDHVWPMRQRNRRESYRLHWWGHVEPRQGMWQALDGLRRFIVPTRVAKHRPFVWLDARGCPDSNTTFRILHSRAHEAWSLRLGSWHGVGNDPSTASASHCRGYFIFPCPPFRSDTS